MDISDEAVERAARAMFEREHSFMSTLAGATRWTYDDASMEIKIHWQKHARGALEASGLAAEVERLTEDRDGYKDDYLRRHKDACDRYEEIIALKQRIAELERAASGLAMAGRIKGLREGLEMAACYHDALAPKSTRAFKDEHRNAAKNIRALFDRQAASSEIRPAPHPHQTRAIKVWVDVDIGIADFVLALNEIEGIRTLASCQGTIGEGGAEPYGPQVMVTWADDAAFARVAHLKVRPSGENYGYVEPIMDNDARIATLSGAFAAQDDGK